MSRKAKDRAFFGVVGAFGLLVFLSVVVIVAYILVKGVPSISIEFLTEAPSAMGRDGGIFPVIIGTLYVTLLGLVIATPVGIAAAIYFTEYAKPGRLVKINRFFTQVLAGIPSIIFGLFGFAFFVLFLGFGWSVLSGGLTLALMILPTIVRTTEEAIKTVPMSYREASFALGGSRWQGIKNVILPTCRNGIMTGVVLGLGRAIGETAAVMLTIGGGLNLPKSVFESTRTMALHLYVLASENLSEDKTYATAALLIIIVLVINAVANKIAGKAFSGD